MSRVLLEYVVPLLLPTLAWLLWWHFRGRHRTPAEDGRSPLAQGPWFWLILTGLLLTGASLITTAVISGHDPGGTYVPPRLEGGRVIPGRVE